MAQTDAPAKLLIETGVITEAEFLAKIAGGAGDEPRKLIEISLDAKVLSQRLRKTAEKKGLPY